MARHNLLPELAAELDTSVASGDLSTALPEQLWTDESWIEGAATEQSTSMAEEDSMGEEYFTAEEASEASLESVDSGGSGRNLSLERRQNGVPLVYLLQDEVLATIFALVVLSYYAKEYKDVHHKPSDQGAILAVCRRLRAIAMDLPVWTVVVVPTKFIRPFLRKEYKDVHHKPSDQGAILAVCRRLRAIAMDLPVWTVVVVPTKFIRPFLRKGQPLDVIVDRFRPINMDNIASFELLRKSTCRVRTAKLILRTTLCSLSPNGHIENGWLWKEMPNLRSLEVARKGAGWGDEIQDRRGAGYRLFDSVTPRLDNVRITSFALSATFQGLSTLSINRVRYHTSSRIASLLEIIRSSPQLQSLCMEQVMCPPPLLSVLGRESVPAPSLRSLRLRDVTVTLIHHLLARLTTAPTLRTDIDITLHSDLNHDLTHIIPSPRSPPSLRDIRHVEIAMTHDGPVPGKRAICIRGVTSPSNEALLLNIRTDVDNYLPARVFSSLATALPFPLDTMTFRGLVWSRHQILPTGLFAQSLRRYASPIRLSFVDCHHFFIAALAVIQDDEPLFPQLEGLFITGDIPENDLLSIASSRHLAGIPLLYISIRDCTSHFATRSLARYVEEVVVNGVRM
ncbi:hypothetical protein BOTBODRAFT_142430 [Botryobasidium botryosum FD-172 SS1]|uniref:Uncharacterized protein n=1 Tax=Botryobasidium botryosum (strain FD-172 SS1) TaxID=930990 RepID=A0A067MZB4_BOTB1|nr:hypothetical protein BOTBODRAFT_142430 [Botryobasidium botryosum FD-172 SS1]